MLYLLFPLLVAQQPAAAAATDAPRSAAADLELHAVRSGGGRRWYRIFVPSGYDPAVPTPVALAYHGGGGNAESIAQGLDLCTYAETYNFLAVFPEGTGALGGPPLWLFQTWNGGGCCGWAMEHDVDDVQFTRDLLDDVEARWNVDPGWVFATGLSNGAILCYRLAAELGDRIAAIAPIAGCRMVSTAPAQPVAIIAFHGRLDCNVPYQGGLGCGISGTVFTGQEYTLAPWIAANQVSVPSAPAEVRGQALRFEGDSALGADIHYWWLRDGGHSIPGHVPFWAPNEPTNHDIDASEELWLFFAAHHR